MEKKNKVDGQKLKLAKETITVLDDKKSSGIKGGDAPPARSTRYDITCTWCTTILPDPEQL